MPRKKKNARRDGQGKRNRRRGSYIPRLEGEACQTWLNRYEKPDRHVMSGRYEKPDWHGKYVKHLSPNGGVAEVAVDSVKRGEIWYADLGSSTRGSVQCGNRPVLIVSNDENNLHSSTVTVLPLTTRKKKIYLKTHVLLENAAGNPLHRESMILAEQITTIDKMALINRVGQLERVGVMEQIAEAIRLQTGC